MSNEHDVSDFNPSDVEISESEAEYPQIQVICSLIFGGSRTPYSHFGGQFFVAYRLIIDLNSIEPYFDHKIHNCIDCVDSFTIDLLIFQGCSSIRHFSRENEF